jgi:hypothetical protein
MGKLSLWAGMLIFIFVSTISPTSLNGRFVVINRDNNKLSVQLQINTSTGTDDLGGATIVIGFNEAVLNFSSTPVGQIDFIFHNFSGGNYSTAKVTKPMSDKIWVNIDLPYVNSNKGTVVSGLNNWTNVATLNFNVVVPNDTILLRWIGSSPFWGVYDADNASLWDSGAFTNLDILPVIVDNIPPDITNITATNSKSVTIKFSEKLNTNSASDINNYSISNNVIINQVQLLPDSTSVLLKTSQQQSNVDFALTIKDISDQSGNLITPNPKTNNYRIAMKSSGNRKIKNTISAVYVSSWDQNYLPEKMIDGNGMNTPDSRWQSSKLMPDTVTYDLGEAVSMDSLRISFYKGESGRLYKYSVYSSKDLTHWNPVVDNVWSDNSEWTAVEFDSTRGRYMKFVLKDCNQGKTSSVWEFESYGTDPKKNTDQDISNPNTFELSQNYPNPFNPGTKIRYTIPASLNSSEGGKLVQLKVYDILGNEVAKLVNELQHPGQHEVVFDAAGLASGVYIYRMETTGFVDTKKMILLR